MMDGKKLKDLKLPFGVKLVFIRGLKKASGTVIEDLLKRYKLV